MRPPQAFAAKHISIVPLKTEQRKNGKEQQMEHRYEYEEVDTDIMGLGHTITGEDCIAYKCTIYDDDTGEELAVGYGWSEREARAEAKNNL